jgi:uncharacterized SAM-binding protein YcdF (DUF218 family)
MNALLLTLGIEGWKPALGALLFPPMPFIAMVLLGAALMRRRALLGWVLVLTASTGLWLMGTEAASVAIERQLLRPPPALGPSEMAALRRAPDTAIVVLGGGRRLLATEYGHATLRPRSAERLRYGIHLARATGLPLAFSGGVGFGAPGGPSEAAVAGQLAEEDYGFKLRWQEGESRDTRENAVRTVALLREQGVRHLVVVTQAYHMPRAMRNFERAVAASGAAMRLSAAPMDASPEGRLEFLDWLPSLTGYEQTRVNLHEWLGMLAGA